MRIPKYQAWHKAEKRMFKVYYLSWLGGVFLIGDKNAETSRRYGSGEVELREFTGLLDKNRKAIYEGDILTVDWKDSRYPTHTIGPVTWDRENACWSLGEGGSPKHDAENYMEVIGNMYENPDLLTETN